MNKDVHGALVVSIFVISAIDEHKGRRLRLATIGCTLHSAELAWADWTKNNKWLGAAGSTVSAEFQPFAINLEAPAG